MNKRKSNFELLRITAMIMVILGHCVLYTAQDQEPYLGIIDNIGWFIKAFTIVAVNCYFLLTGYFAKREEGKCGRVLKIWIKTVIYSIIIYLLFVMIGGEEFSIKIAIKYLFPVITKQYWFILTYIVLALLSPFLCIIVDNSNIREHTILIFVCVVFFSLHETFITVSDTLDNTQGYGIICGCMLFIIGKWLNKYGDEYIERINGGLWLVLYLLISTMIFFSNYLIMKLEIAGGISSRGNFYAYNSITVLLASICFFCFFVSLRKRIKDNLVVNWLSGNCVAAYLITAHPLLIGFLWTDIFKMNNYGSNPILYVIVAIFFSIMSFLVCILVDKLLDCIMAKIGLLKVFKIIDNRINSFINSTKANMEVT